MRSKALKTYVFPKRKFLVAQTGLRYAKRRGCVAGFFLFQSQLFKLFMDGVKGLP